MRLNIYTCGPNRLSREILEDALNAPHIQHLLKIDALCGCIHPPLHPFSITDIVTIKADEVSHKLSDFEFDGDKLFANVTPLDTEHGIILNRYIDRGCSFSARALSNIDKTQVHLVTFDVVELNIKMEG